MFRMVFFFAAWLMAGGASAAGLCDAAFMHEGGHARFQGSGALRLGASLHFSDVSKESARACEARVTGSASYGFAGLPDGSSRLDFIMTVQDGQARFERRLDDGSRQPAQSRFDLRMLGLFAYGEPIREAGQTFPEMRFHIQVGSKSRPSPVEVHTGLKTVGEARLIDTAVGERSCWPVRYTRSIAPTQARFKGFSLPIPGMQSQVTDWFCPDLNMVMRQESRQAGLNSLVQVIELR